MNDPSALQYDFLSPQRIHFGWGRRREAGPLAATLGHRAFLVLGSRTLTRSGAVNEIEQSLMEHNVEPVRLTTISHEPEVTDVDRAVAGLIEQNAAAGDLVLGVGGGSAVDLAKAVAALATNRHGSSVVDFLEGVGRGLRIEKSPLPIMAMPTTSGTGSEATKNAVISSYAPLFKKSLRSELMVPRIVLIDPELSASVSRQVTAYTGLDAITQLIESYVSRRSQPIPRALGLHGLRLAAGAILEAVENGASRRAREDMSHAALLSGLALANSGLGMAHGVAAALGVHCRVPHGLACAVMLPAAMRVNRHVCPDRFAELAPAITGREWPNDAEAVDAAIARIDEIITRVGVPRSLTEVGVVESQLPALAASSRGNSMSGNPRELSDPELMQILEEML